MCNETTKPTPRKTTESRQPDDFPALMRILNSDVKPLDPDLSIARPSCSLASGGMIVCEAAWARPGSFYRAPSDPFPPVESWRLLYDLRDSSWSSRACVRVRVWQLLALKFLDSKACALVSIYFGPKVQDFMSLGAWLGLGLPGS